MSLKLEWFACIDTIRRKHKVSPDRVLKIETEVAAAVYILEGGTLEQLDARMKAPQENPNLMIAGLMARVAVSEIESAGVNAENAIAYVERRLQEFESEALNKEPRSLFVSNRDT